MILFMLMFYTFTLQRSRNEIMKIIAERIQKCSSDCKKFLLYDLATTVLEKDNYVSILVSSKSLFVEKFSLDYLHRIRNKIEILHRLIRL